ncbi:MAG: SIR2 family protein, partial [Propionicimonas sp.]|nr:SIR2 family protein [Propionicimonas sp.]
MVTTNFDDHLWAAADAVQLKLDRWVAPALPLGDDFLGIVHLHGSVLRQPSSLVLTDRDFGRSYLTDAWATRFLRRMFDVFTVVFIGYSHDDPIMQYMALGLPSGTRRYALTHEPHHHRWGHLGIVPIAYPAQEHDHSALLRALEAWNRWARMSRTEHRTRTREIIEGGLPLKPVDQDYLTARLQSVDGAQEFARNAHNLAWLRWVEELPQFKAMFAGEAPSDAANVLASWFASTYVERPETHGAALQTVLRLGQRLCPRLTQHISWATEPLAKADPVAGRRWKTFLASSVEGQTTPPDLAELLSYGATGAPADPFLVRTALRPSLLLKSSWLHPRDDPTAPPEAELRWHTDETVLTEHVRKVVDEAEPGDPSIGSALEDALVTAHDLLSAYHSDRVPSRLSFGRSAIEPHEQDEFREPIDALIDGLREYGAKGLPVRPDLPEQWWQYDLPLFRRLALYLLDTSPSRTADEKLRWLLDRELLYAFDEKHETYSVLAHSTAQASPDVRQALLAAAREGPPPDDMPDSEHHRAYIQFNLLVWLSRVAPEWAEATAALQASRAANPTFGEREHPDLDHWTTSGFVSEDPPRSPT